MPHDYFSERTLGAVPRDRDEVSENAWKGIVGLARRGISEPWFAKSFSLMCPDGHGPFACDEDQFRLALEAEHPGLEWPLSPGIPPPASAVMDLLEFLYMHASAASSRGHHGYFNHDHLRFDVDEGQAEFRAAVNRVLSRNGLAYELGKDGMARRLAPPILAERLHRRLPATRDHDFDRLLERATAKYLSTDLTERRESLEPLWDAFERSKTVLDSDKKAGAEALLTAAAESQEEKLLLENEMRELTKIGNKFRIRHHETDKAETNNALVDALFGRCYALIYRLHKSLR